VGGDSQWFSSKVECQGSVLVGWESSALSARSAKIQGGAFLQRLKAKGGVDLTGATAISAGGAKVDGNVFFRATAKTKLGPQVDGTVRFAHAQIGGNFQWQDIESPEKASLDLRFTKISLLRNEEKSWPITGNLQLDGFAYDQFDDPFPNAKVQLSWLHLQPEKPFSSQPYEQLLTMWFWFQTCLGWTLTTLWVAGFTGLVRRLN
jgi:hypothetical protein